MDENKGALQLARLDRIPVWPYSYWILVVVGVGFFFAFFDIITIGLALPVIIKQFHTTIEVAIWAVTSSLIGYIIGSFLDSRISDMFGRRIALMLSMLFFSVGSVLSATSPNIVWLIIWRFIIGMGIGSEIANVTTYIGELAPASSRGRFSCIAISVGFIGFVVVPFVGLAFIPNFTWGWRAVFAFGGLGGFAILFWRRFLPHSIRWFVAKKRFDEAEELLVQAETLAEKRYKKTLPEPKIEPITELQTTKGFKDLFRSPYIFRALFFAFIWLIYYIGNYGWLTLDTKLFLLRGYDLENSILLVAVASVGMIIGSLLAIFFGDSLERKYLVSMAATVWTIALLIIAWIPSEAIIYIFGFIAAMTISFLIPLLYTYTAENFPTPFRATGVSITDGIGHLGGAFCGQIIMGVYFWFKATGYGVNAAFTCMAVTGALTAVLVLFGIRMNNKQLKQ